MFLLKNIIKLDISSLISWSCNNFSQMIGALNEALGSSLFITNLYVQGQLGDQVAKPSE